MPVRDMRRVVYGLVLIAAGGLLLTTVNDLAGRLSSLFQQELFIWTFSWSLLCLGVYALLYGWFWQKDREELRPLLRRFFRYAIFLLTVSALFSSWISWLQLDTETQYLAGFGFGMFFGTFAHTAIKGIATIFSKI